MALDTGQVEMSTHGNVSTAQGGLVLFPSFLPHKVHRVTDGVRYSIVAWFVGAWGPPYWRQGAAAYSTMLTERPEICEAHEWYAETLASEGARDAAVESLVDCIECNDGGRVLQDRVLSNGAGSPRYLAALLGAEQRFRARLASAPDAETAAVPRENLRKVLVATGREKEAEALAAGTEEERREATVVAGGEAAVGAREDMLDGLLDEL